MLNPLLMAILTAMTEIKTIGNGLAGPGRPKGMTNKTTTLLKEAILRAADEAGGSGGVVEYLTLQAHENPAAFMGLLGKVLPMQVAHSGEVPVTTIRIVGPLTDPTDPDSVPE